MPSGSDGFPGPAGGQLKQQQRSRDVRLHHRWIPRSSRGVYVAATRAKKELLVLSYGRRSEFLDKDDYAADLFGSA